VRTAVDIEHAAEGMIVVGASRAIQSQHNGSVDEEACRMNSPVTMNWGAEPRLMNEGCRPKGQGLDTGGSSAARKPPSLGPRPPSSQEIALSEIATASSTTKFIAVVRDITERKSWEKRIYTLAYSDSLTGLPNRLLLRDRLEHAIATAQRNGTLVGVLFFDLDHFKAINDSYGHHVGDVLLRELGERAKSCRREIDTGSRLGGDEFCLVWRAEAAMGGRGQDPAGPVATYHIEGVTIITPTVGTGIFPRDGVDADTLLRNADRDVPRQGKRKNNFRFYDPERSALASSRPRADRSGNSILPATATEQVLARRPWPATSPGTSFGTAHYTRFSQAGRQEPRASHRTRRPVDAYSAFVTAGANAKREPHWGNRRFADRPDYAPAIGVAGDNASGHLHRLWTLDATRTVRSGGLTARTGAPLVPEAICALPPDRTPWSSHHVHGAPMPRSHAKP
jgi:diguanylate cyclase (GGDEF)-like protein